MIQWDTLGEAPLGVYVLTICVNGLDRYNNPVTSRTDMYYPNLKLAYAGFRQLCLERRLDESCFRLGLVSTTLIVSRDCETPHLNYYQLDLWRAFASLGNKNA